MVKKNETVFITGASEGIGLELAKIFAQNGYDLILLARNKEKLSNLKSEITKIFDVDIKVLNFNLSDNNELENLGSYLKQNDLMIDIFINNAGTGILGEFSKTDFSKEAEMINLNITALTYLTKTVLQKMLKINRGKIVNVASTAAYKPGPLMAVYYATKSYVLSFTRAIAAEIKDSDINILALCPGPTDTGFMSKASDNKIYKSSFIKSASASEVAKYGYDAIMKNKSVAIPGMTNKILILISKFIPEKITSYLIYMMKRNK